MASRRDLGAPRAILRFAALLLLSALGLVALGVSAKPQGEFCSSSPECIACIISSCDGSVIVNGVASGDAKVVDVRVAYDRTPPSYAPGERCTAQLGSSYTGNDPTNQPSTVTLAYTPPDGAGNLTLDPPTDRQDGDTYYWDNVPLDQDGAMPTHTASFDVPDTPSGRATSTAWVEWTTPYGEDTIEGRTSYVNVSSGSGAKSRSQAVADPAPGPRAGETVDLYQIELWIAPGEGQAISEALWSQYLSAAPEGTPFVAIQFPLGSLHTESNSYDLPVVFGGEHNPCLKLIDYSELPSSPVYTQTLVYRPQYLDLLERAYPDDDDLYWVALGLPGDADLDPPPGLNIAEEKWEAYLSIWLDLRGVPDELSDETIYLYVGFEGDGVTKRSAQASALGLALEASGSSAHLYQGGGVTIVGPMPVRLRGRRHVEPAKPGIKLDHANAGRIEPGGTITTWHKIGNLTQDAIAVDLAVETDLGSTVALYVGEWGGPKLPLEPLPNPLPLDARSSAYVALVGQMPAGAQGVEAWTLHATIAGQPDETTSVTDLFWVGDWMTPVADYPIVRRPYVYVPLAIR